MSKREVIHITAKHQFRTDIPLKIYIKMSNIALKNKALNRKGKNRTSLMVTLIEDFNEEELNQELIAKGLNPKQYEFKMEDFYK